MRQTLSCSRTPFFFLGAGVGVSPGCPSSPLICWQKVKEEREHGAGEVFINKFDAYFSRFYTHARSSLKHFLTSLARRLGRMRAMYFDRIMPSRAHSSVTINMRSFSGLSGNSSRSTRRIAKGEKSSRRVSMVSVCLSFSPCNCQFLLGKRS